MKTKVKGYTFVILLIGAFALTIYGAYSPARKAQKQQIVCVKFRKDVNNQAIERHMLAFAALKREIPAIISYTSGKTISSTDGSADYDVMHYLTFQSEIDMQKFEQDPTYQKFVAQNEGIWEKTLTVNADIRQ